MLNQASIPFEGDKLRSKNLFFNSQDRCALRLFNWSTLRIRLTCILLLDASLVQKYRHGVISFGALLAFAHSYFFPFSLALFETFMWARKASLEDTVFWLLLTHLFGLGDDNFARKTVLICFFFYISHVHFKHSQRVRQLALIFFLFASRVMRLFVPLMQWKHVFRVLAGASGWLADYLLHS